MKKLSISFQNKYEFLYFGIYKQSSVSHLMITSLLIESFFSLIEQVVPPTNDNYEAAKNKIDTILGIKSNLSPTQWIEAPSDELRDPVNKKNKLNNKIIEEVSILRYAVINWVDKQHTPSFNTISNQDETTQKALMFMQLALMKSPIIPIIGGGIGRRHDSDGLIPLAWAEIWYALEKNIRARCCPYCGTVFILPPNNLRKTTCLRPPCKIKYEIDRHGGIEAYREWERTRKIKRDPEKPKKAGRPKKQKEGE